MAGKAKSYIPAAGSDWLLPLFDPIAKLMGIEKARRALLDQATLRPGSRVLDIGCGTGSFCIMLKRLHPDMVIVGLDPDPKALARSRAKSNQATVEIQFDQGFSQALPYGDATFDYVFSSMMFHHLELNDKETTLRQVRRVLKPRRLFAMVDFAEPESLVARILTGFFHPEILKDNSEARVLTLMMKAGLVNAKVIGQGKLSIGRLVYYQGLSGDA
jgi:ubiquinone/menaquinone biosynthesis C-methylase UbiE